MVFDQGYFYWFKTQLVSLVFPPTILKRQKGFLIVHRQTESSWKHTMPEELCPKQEAKTMAKGEMEDLEVPSAER